MTVAALTPTLVELEETQEYLRDQGHRDGNQDHLQRIINGVTGEVYALTERARILDDDSTITEYRDGDGSNCIFTNEYPITAVTTVTLYPHETILTEAITGPGTSVSNDDMIVDQPGGKIILKNDLFPAATMGVQIDYKAGHASGSSSLEALRLVMFQQVQARWQRFIEKPGIISTREAGDDRWTFKSDAVLHQAWVSDLAPWRRLHW
jgi:hypothetical protein